MEPIYKQISDEEIEVTYFTEHKQIIRKSDLIAQKEAILAANTSDVDAILSKFK